MMRGRAVGGLSIAALLLASVGRDANAQDRASSHDWAKLRGASVEEHDAVRVPRGRGLSGGATYGAAVLGTAVGMGGIWIGGMAVGTSGAAICSVARDRAGDESHRRTGKCLTNDGIVYGAMLGSLAASSAAVRVFAEREGCAFADARRRSLRGALLGTVPSVLWLVARPELIGPGRLTLDWSRDLTTLVAGTPVLQAAGAALDVRRCARRRV